MIDFMTMTQQQQLATIRELQATSEKLYPKSDRDDESLLQNSIFYNLGPRRRVVSASSLALKVIAAAAINEIDGHRLLRSKAKLSGR